MWMQSSSESGRVAYCLPIGITSSKTKCVRLGNGRSLQQIIARAIVYVTGRTCVVHCLYALYKNFSQNVLVSSSFWSPRKRQHGPCIVIEAEAVRMTMHRHQTYNFRFQLLRQKIVWAYNIAAVCCKSHVQENMLISNRVTSIQGKTISRLSEFRVSFQNFRVSFWHPKTA